MSNIVQVPFAPSLNQLWPIRPQSWDLWRCAVMPEPTCSDAYCRSYYLSMPWDVCGILWPASVQSLWYGGPHDVVLGAWWVASSTNTSKLLLVRWSMLFTSPVSSLKAYVMVQSVGLKHALSLTNKQNNPTEECCLLYMAFHIYLHISVL